jgi:hypothetical protein
MEKSSSDRQKCAFRFSRAERPAPAQAERQVYGIGAKARV